MNRFRSLLAAALLGTCGLAKAGSLEPPPGPVAPTMKTLSKVEARTPIHQSDLPLAIFADGAYYLAENLYATQNGANMITVSANYASIDLNGFTISGTSQVAVAGMCIEIVPGVQSFGLENGVIRGCGQWGVHTSNPTGLTYTVDHVQANQNGIGGMWFGSGSYGVISRCVARSNVDKGIFVADGVVTDCAAYSNGGVGLHILYGVLNGCIARLNGGGNAFITQGGASAVTYAP